MNHFVPGILDWVIGDHSAATFAPLWERIKAWACYFWVTDGYPVYPQFISEGDPIISKTDMTRVEGENTRLRHYLARLHRKTLCYSKSVAMLNSAISNHRFLPLGNVVLLERYLIPKTGAESA